METLKQKLYDKGEVPPNQQRIMFAGKELKDDHPLSDSNILSVANLIMVERKPSGGSESTSLSSTAGPQILVKTPNGGTDDPH